MSKYLLAGLIAFLLCGCETIPVLNISDSENSSHLSISKTKKRAIPPSSKETGLFSKVLSNFQSIGRSSNSDSYQVEGQNFSILKTSSGYKTRGIASWYGNKFHHKRTSSGEPYNMYALSAAHKTLPLPSYVMVRNLSNGRSTVVKINDRGPFHQGRIIDLSYAAAVKLALFPKGIAPVEIEILHPKIKGKAAKAHYYLQAGAFSSRPYAEALRLKLMKLTGSPIYIERIHRHYVLRIGPFAKKSMIDKFKLLLNKQRIKNVSSVLV